MFPSFIILIQRRQTSSVWMQVGEHPPCVCVCVCSASAVSLPSAPAPKRCLMRPGPDRTGQGLALLTAAGFMNRYHEPRPPQRRALICQRVETPAPHYWEVWFSFARGCLYIFSTYEVYSCFFIIFSLILHRSYLFVYIFRFLLEKN